MNRTKLRQFRKAAGLTYQQLADKAGISKPYVWALEKDTVDPSLSVVRRIARALGVHPGELIKK